jgi:hypothetical protein
VPRRPDDRECVSAGTLPPDPDPPSAMATAFSAGRMEQVAEVASDTAGALEPETGALETGKRGHRTTLLTRPAQRCIPFLFVHLRWLLFRRGMEGNVLMLVCVASGTKRSGTGRNTPIVSILWRAFSPRAPVKHAVLIAALHVRLPCLEAFFFKTPMSLSPTSARKAALGMGFRFVALLTTRQPITARRRSCSSPSLVSFNGF